MKKFVPNGPPVIFPDGVIFIRRAKEEELPKSSALGPDEIHHALVHEDGVLLCLVEGDHTFAYEIAANYQLCPVWIH